MPINNISLGKFCTPVRLSNTVPRGRVQQYLAILAYLIKPVSVSFPERSLKVWKVLRARFDHIIRGEAKP
ncbi:UNVERIFIED_ORG: hypothetical protein M2435_001952 [Rhizobium sophorae]|nr:hypothetical protein [Rhizobium leguminosarum]MDH6659049.1 hypothetical protein [Rhizobium sophorae]